MRCCVVQETNHFIMGHTVEPRLFTIAQGQFNKRHRICVHYIHNTEYVKTTRKAKKKNGRKSLICFVF